MSRYWYLISILLACAALSWVNASHGPFVDESVECNGLEDDCGPPDENFKTDHLEIIIPEDYPDELPIEQDEDFWHT